MDIIDYQSCSLEQLEHAVLNMTPDELQHDIPQMSHEQISKVFSLLNSDRDPNWEKKIKSAIAGLSDPHQLEPIGRSLNLKQILQILKSIAKEDYEKLSPILVGMPPFAFSQLLTQTSPEEFEILKQEAIAEPIQHHLTVFTHELFNVLNELNSTLELLETSIEMLDPSRYGQNEIDILMQAIDQSRKVLVDIVGKTNKALAIAWNTTRTDLIEKLSYIKETSQRYQGSIVGNPRTDTSEQSGLYLKLEERLHAIYGDPNDPNDTEALQDDEPAIEALVKFSVWYLQDYWEIGLLPAIARPLDLDLDKESHSERERTEYRANLFKEVQDTLHKLGLDTVKDLKNACIFSRKALKDFISQSLENKR